MVCDFVDGHISLLLSASVQVCSFWLPLEQGIVGTSGQRGLYMYTTQRFSGRVPRFMKAEQGDVHIVDTAGSDRAVAGDLFCLPAIQKGLRDIVVGGPTHSSVFVHGLPIACYTRLHERLIQEPVVPRIHCRFKFMCWCYKVKLLSAPAMDSTVIADSETFEALLPESKSLCQAETASKESLLNGTSLPVVTNYNEHIPAHLAGKPSSLGFKV